jgi:hypothetical protein
MYDDYDNVKVKGCNKYFSYIFLLWFMIDKYDILLIQ